MIAVILDSNILYNDPFLVSPTLKRLIAYASIEKIEILISDVVLEEVVNNNRSRLKTTNDKITTLIGGLRRISGSQEVNVQELCVEKNERDLRLRYSELVSSNLIIMVPYDNELLPELVERAVKKVKPFSEKKEEFRDAVIWLSCVNYLHRKKTYCSAFFVTDNKSDFCSKDGSLHEDLKKDHDSVVLHESVQRLFSEQKEMFSELIPEDTSTELLEYISSSPPDEASILDALGYHFKDLLNERYISDVAHIEISDVLGYPSTGYVQASEADDIQLGKYDFDVDVSSVIVSGEMLVTEFAGVFEYNLDHDVRGEKYRFSKEALLRIKYGFTYSVSPENIDPYDFEITDADVEIT